MKTVISRLGVLGLLMACVFLWAPHAAAQLTQLSGTVLDLEGKPYPGVVITVSDKNSAAKYTVTTDKDGKYSLKGLRTGTYDINFKKDNIDFTQTFQINGSMTDTGAVLNMNFKEIAAKSGYDVEAAKKRAEEVNKLKEMKTHFDNGIRAMDDAKTVKVQLRTATGDQKETLQASVNTDYQTAVTEFEQARQNAPDKDPNLQTILSNLGEAYESAGKYDQAVDTIQQAVTIKQTPRIYAQLGTALAYDGKMQDATAACDKAATLDPADKNTGEMCYKNMGIVLSNAGRMPDATVPLQKASELNPNDAELWYLLGNALVAQIDEKNEGGKEVYVIPPGTKEAYQKYLQLQPDGPYAAEVKAVLDSPELKGEQAETDVKNKKKKPGAI